MVSVKSVKSPVSLANSTHLLSGCSHRTAAGPDGKHRSAVADGVCGLCNSYTDFRSYKFAIKPDRQLASEVKRHYKLQEPIWDGVVTFLGEESNKILGAVQKAENRFATENNRAVRRLPSSQQMKAHKNSSGNKALPSTSIDIYKLADRIRATESPDCNSVLARSVAVEASKSFWQWWDSIAEARQECSHRRKNRKGTPRNRRVTASQRTYNPSKLLRANKNLREDWLSFKHRYTISSLDASSSLRLSVDTPDRFKITTFKNVNGRPLKLRLRKPVFPEILADPSAVKSWHIVETTSKRTRKTRDSLTFDLVLVAKVCLPVLSLRPEENPLGFDRGIDETVADSAGNFYVRPPSKGQEEYKRNQRKMKRYAQGSRNYRKLAHKNRKIKTGQNHRNEQWDRQCASEIVKTAVAAGSTSIVSEDLSVRNMMRSGKGDIKYHGSSRKAGLNRSLAGARLAGLQNRVEMTAQNFGLRSYRVNPRFTSQTCSQCLHSCKGNRGTGQRRQSFRCRNCGYATHAGTNAAVNIATIFADPEHWSAGMAAGNAVKSDSRTGSRPHILTAPPILTTPHLPDGTNTRICEHAEKEAVTKNTLNYQHLFS